MQPLINFLYEFGILRRLKRSHHLHLFTEDTESVADHSHRAMAIAYFMAKKVNADAGKAMLMAAFHDMAETRTGDANWIQKNYVEHNEEKVLHAQFDQLGELGQELKDVMEEYRERKSLESKIAKDADRIEYFMSLKELEVMGNKYAERRLVGKDNSVEYLLTDIGKELGTLVKNTDPNDWTIQDMTATHLKYTHAKSK